MKLSTIIIFGGLCALLMLSACTITERETDQTSQEPIVTGIADDAELKTVDTDELLEHNSETDCWIAFDGKVYDITDYLPRYDGGKETIISYCGTADDFSAAFTSQHGTSKVNELMSEGILMGELPK